jgi:arginyl-tRNA synthetase
LSRFSLYGTARRAITDALSQVVSNVFPSFPGPVLAVALERPANPAHGDYSTTIAFDLAKALRRAPREIAREIVEKIGKIEGVAEIRVAGAGYVNFALDRGAFAARFFREDGLPPAPTRADVGKIIVEHTNINPNKAAHIGHLRNAVLGDTLVRCLRQAGRAVEVQNYIDDTGVQVADVVVGFLDFERWTLEEIEDRIAAPARGDKKYACFGDLCWDVYADVGRTYEARPETRGLRTETLHAMEEGRNLRASAAAMISAAITREHVATMGRIGVSYDLLPRESDILAKHFWTRAFALLRERRAIMLETEGKHAGCWVMKLTASEEFAGLEEPDKILVRSNGTVTYTGKDIAYQLWKFGKLGLDFDYAPFAPDWNAGRGGAGAVSDEIQRHPIWQTQTGSTATAPAFGGGTEVINVIDVRQSYPQKVVREGLRALGFEGEADRSVHFAYEMVALTPATVKRLAESFGDEYRLSPEDEEKPWVEMSGRKGQGVRAHDLLETLVEQAEGQIRDREPDLDPAAARERARAIAVGALRYFLLKFGRNKIIAFDFDEALNFEGDTGPYLQYSSVRVENILRKLEERGLSSDVDPDALAAETWEDDLWELFVETARIDDVVARAVETLEIAAVARHAYGLAQAFSRFYHRHPILAEDDARVRQRRLAAALAFRTGLLRLLSLLGIPSPKKM